MPFGRLAENLEPGKPHTAACRHQAGNRVAQRRLAHAVAADDGEHARIKRQRDALQRMRVAIVDVEADDLERGHAGGR